MNGTNVVHSNIFLYDVSEPLDRHEANECVHEPRSRKVIDFFLNRSFLKMFELKESQLWSLNQSYIDSNGRIFFSVIYEE